MDWYSFFISSSTFSSLHVSADSTSASDYGVSSDRNTNTSNDVSSSSESVRNSSGLGSGSQGEFSAESNESIQQDQTEQTDEKTNETTDSREDKSTIQFNGKNGDWRVGFENDTTDENVYNSFVPDGSSWDIPLENETEEDISFSSFMQPMMLMARAAGVNLTKPPRSNSSYPGGYYINGYYEGMKIPLPSNLNNMAIIIELLIMQTRDSVQNLYYGLASVNNQVNKNRDVADQNNLDRFNENVRAIANAATAQNTANSAKSSISGLQSSNQDRFNEIASLSVRMTSAESSNKDRVKDISNLQTSINKNVNAISAIQSSLDTRVKEITALQSSNKDRATETGSLSNRASSLESAMKDRVSEINGLKSSNTDRAKETGSLANRATSLESAMKDRVKEIATLVQNNKDRVAEITSLQTSNGDRAKETASLTNRASSLESAMKDRVTEINGLGAWKNVQLAWNLKQETNNSNQQKAIDTNKNSLSSQQSEIEKLKEKHKYKRIQSGSLNDLIDTGIYSISRKDVSDNAPGAGNYLLEVVRFYDTGKYGLVMQKATREGNGTTYTRMSKYPGEDWSEWKKDIDSDDLTNLKNQVFNDSKNYTNQEVSKVKSVNDSQTSVINTLVSDMKKRVDEINALGAWKNVQLAWNLKQETNNSNQQKAIDTNKNDISVIDKRTTFQLLNGTDLNTLKAQGYYYVSSPLNVPEPLGSIYVINEMYSSNRIKQTITSDKNSKTYIRIFSDYQNIGWSKWESVTNQSDIDNVNNLISEVKKVNNNQEISINSLVSAMKDRVTEINGLGAWKNVQLAWNLKQETDNSNQQKAIDANKNNIISNKKLIDVNTSSITSMKTISNNHETRIASLESTDWTSVFNSAGIIHAIDVVRDKILVLITSVDNLALNNLNSFSGINSNLRDLKTMFSDYDKGSFWVNIRSHLAIQKVLFDEGINQVDSTLVLILNGINSIGDGLNTANNWLELLTMKPSDWSPEDTSKLPPFWNSGGGGGGLGWAGVIKEAIKLVGSVIKTAIETLGDLLGKGIDGVFASVGDILDFLNSLIDKIIALIVPENMDFMTDTFDNINVKFKLKFGSVLGLADMFKSAFTPASADFESAVSFNLLGVEFKPKFGMIGDLVSKARSVMALMIWLNVAWYIYKRLTGSGDLINDN